MEVFIVVFFYLFGIAAFAAFGFLASDKAGYFSNKGDEIKQWVCILLAIACFSASACLFGIGFKNMVESAETPTSEVVIDGSN